MIFEESLWLIEERMIKGKIVIDIFSVRFPFLFFYIEIEGQEISLINKVCSLIIIVIVANSSILEQQMSLYHVMMKQQDPEHLLLLFYMCKLSE
jgi:hypothetical protein